MHLPIHAYTHLQAQAQALYYMVTIPLGTICLIPFSRIVLKSKDLNGCPATSCFLIANAKKFFAKMFKISLRFCRSIGVKR